MNKSEEDFIIRINAISNEYQAIRMYNEYIEGMDYFEIQGTRMVLSSAIMFEVRKGRVDAEQAKRVLEWMGLDK